MNTNFLAMLIIALFLVTAPAATLVSYAGTDENDNGNGNGENGKDNSILKEKPIKCQVKVQVKALNAANNTIYLAELDDLPSQAKQANFNQSEIDSGDNNVAFVFQYKKGGDACPEKGDTEYGNLNGQEFAVVINYLTKMNKIGVDLSQ